MVKLVSLKIVLLSVLIRTELVRLQTQENTSAVREKRVVYGREALQEDRDYYDIFRYYVFLSKNQPSWFWRKINRRVNPDLEDLVCGGSLLTPFIVQTAAHCVAVTYEMEGSDLNPVVTRNVWEDPLYTYVGNNMVSEMREWLKPAKYLTYARTAAMKRGGVWSGDIGLVITKKTILDRAPTAPISYAPVYPEDSIKQFYDDAVTKEYMCLHVGHGYWNVLYGELGYSIERLNSDPIRWGWRTVMNELDCEYVTYSVRDRKVFDFNYSQHKTWVCSQSMNHVVRQDDFIHHTGRGDSGGPCACNNIYFAVTSGGSTGAADHIISYSTPIVYFLFENSAETRDELIDHWKSLSRSPPKLFVHYILLLAIIIVCL